MSSMMVLMTIILFFSCSNDMENVIKVSEFEKLPELLGENIHFVQTEYGKIIISIETPKIVKQTKDENEIMEFPQGIKVIQFSNYPDTASFIRADYAINYPDKNKWEARGNIIARNTKNQETLNTEYLIWDQGKGTISSNQKVKVNTADDVIYGEGFESDDQFSDWHVTNVTGVISIESDVDIE